MPSFSRLLAIAVRAAQQTHLSYLGVDLVIDSRRGPVVLELNARPGLSIQLANGVGLLPVLDQISREVPQRSSPVARHRGAHNASLPVETQWAR